MNLPNFKDILQKLSVFKNNLPLLLSVIIVLIGVLLLIPTQLMSSKLKAEIQTNSIAIGKKVQYETETAVSREGWIQKEERQREHAKDANEIAVLAERSTQRELLSYDIFLDPNISSTLVFQEFGQRYREAIDDLLTRANAGGCPTEAEIERGLEESAVNSSLRRGRSYRGMGSSGMPSVRPPGMPLRGIPGSRGLPGRSRRLGELEGMIVDEICRERAKSISVYANPADLSGYDFWADYRLAVEPNEAIGDCWYFQLAYWVTADIFDTISAVNSEYDSVLTAPVKRLMLMSFNMGLRRPGAGRRFRGRGRGIPQTNRDEVDKPTYVLSVDDGLTISCTGRVSNDANNIDVIHFNIAVVINTKSVLPFMQQLCSAKKHKFKGFSGDELEQTFKHNQITVLETKFRSVEDEPYSLYDYGEDPVVELDLICEYIFNKKGYEEIKPETVKEAVLKAAAEKEANSTSRVRR
ncbi:MAG: hypothetical protein IIC00_12190 [Planctomycetes bacterium]|nr:hypothetical protein [Planctomycetota bacterium]